MRRLIKNSNQNQSLNQQSLKSTKRRLVYCKLGKPPASAADIKSILRNLIQTNPIAFEAKVKEAVSTTEGFNEEDLSQKIADYNNDPGNQTFEEVFNTISDGLNQAISRRRQRAEEIGRRNGYQVQNLGNNVFKVKDLDDQDIYQVDLTNEKCSCLDHQRLATLELWCKHLYGVWAQTQNLQDIG